MSELKPRRIWQRLNHLSLISDAELNLSFLLLRLLQDYVIALLYSSYVPKRNNFILAKSGPPTLPTLQQCDGEDVACNEILSLE